MKKIVLTIIVALITFGGYYVLTIPPVVEDTSTTTIQTTSDVLDTISSSNVEETTTTTESLYLGTVFIVVIDSEGIEVINDEIGYVAGDTLFTLLDANYTLGCADSSYQLTDVCEPIGLNSRVLLQIDTVITNWTNSYLAIYVNDQYSAKGLDLIPIEDGTIYKFVYQGV